MQKIVLYYLFICLCLVGAKNINAVEDLISQHIQELETRTLSIFKRGKERDYLNIHLSQYKDYLYLVAENTNDRLKKEITTKNFDHVRSLAAFSYNYNNEHLRKNWFIKDFVSITVPLISIYISFKYLVPTLDKYLEKKKWTDSSRKKARILAKVGTVIGAIVIFGLTQELLFSTEQRVHKEVYSWIDRYKR